MIQAAKRHQGDPPTLAHHSQTRARTQRPKESTKHKSFERTQLVLFFFFSSLAPSHSPFGNSHHTSKLKFSLQHTFFFLCPSNGAKSTHARSNGSNLNVCGSYLFIVDSIPSLFKRPVLLTRATSRSTNTDNLLKMFGWIAAAVGMVRLWVWWWWWWSWLHGNIPKRHKIRL